MRRVVIDKKEYYVSTMTPITLIIEEEKSITVAKVFVDGKEYTVNINENKKAQMTQESKNISANEF